MGTKEVSVCRLCLRECESGLKVIIEEPSQSMLSFILLTLDLGISDEPVMCNRCSVDLEKCFNFKTGCLNKNSLLDNIPKATEFDPWNIQPDESVTHAAGTSNSSDVCCLCMRRTEEVDSFMFLRDEEDVISILEAYFPEMDLNVTEGSLICCPCCKFLENYLAFIKNCLLIETRIKEFCECEGTNSKGQVELNDVIYFMPKSMVFIDSDNSSLMEEDYKLEDNEVVVKDESEISIEEEGILFNSYENESDCIKIEHGYCNRLESITPAYQCENSQYEANSKSDLRKHMSSHEKIYECPDCSYKSNLKHNLYRHRSYRQPPNALYECGNCGYDTRLSRCFRQHKCTRKLAKSSSYISTRWTSYKRMMYHCSKCTYSTRNQRVLLKHMETHREGALACEECPSTHVG